MGIIMVLSLELNNILKSFTKEYLDKGTKFNVPN